MSDAPPVSPRQPLIRLLRETMRWRAQLAIAVVSVALLGLAQLYLTWLVKRWMDGPLATGDLRALRSLLTEAAAVVVGGAAAVAVSRYSMTNINQRLVEWLRNRALDRVLVLEYPVASALPDGDVMARLLHDAATLAGFLETFVRRLVREATIGLGSIVMLFVLDWKLALATVAIVPSCAILLTSVGGRIRRSSLAAHQEIGMLGAMLSEQLHGLSTIKIFGTERVEADRFAVQNGRFRDSLMHAELWAVVLLGAVFLATGLALIAVVFYGTREIVSGQVSRTTLLAFCLYAGQTVEPLRRLSEIQGFLQGMVAAASRVYEIVDHPGVERSTGLPLSTDRVPDIRCDSVRFSYGDGPVLRDVVLNVPGGDQLALVGASGSGKTTLARLLVGLYYPTAGSIRVAGVETASARLVDLRRVVCCVEQEPFLFTGTVFENVAYGAAHPHVRAVRDALTLVGLDAFVAALPSDLQTVLSEAGRQISGGERQRIALARAVVRDPRVLVLDEATSALDGETEAALFDRMRGWFAQRTVIAIAHRLSTVRRFPRTVLIENGRIAADGQTDALIGAHPAFASLFAEQLDALGANLAL